MLYKEVATLDTQVMNLIMQLHSTEDEIERVEIAEKLTVIAEARDELKIQHLEMVCKARQNRIAENEGLDAEIKRMKVQKDYNDKAIEFYESSLSQALAENDNEPFNAGTFKVSSRKSQSLFVDEEVFNDERFQTIVETKKIDKNAIKAALKEGEEIVGVELITNQNLQVK